MAPPIYQALSFIESKFKSPNINNFKNIILIAFLSSILNSIGNFVTKMALIDDYGTLFNQELFLYVLGDFLGTILLFLLYVKWLKKYLMKFFAEKH